MRDQVKNTAAACACVRCLFSVQVMVRLTPHAFSIKTTGSQLPRSELRVFTKESDTHEEEKKSQIVSLRTCIWKTLMCVSQALGRGAEAWLEGLGPNE